MSICSACPTIIVLDLHVVDGLLREVGPRRKKISISLGSIQRREYLSLWSCRIIHVSAIESNYSAELGSL